MAKNIGTLGLIFGSTTFGQNNCSQVLPPAMNEPGSLAHSSCANCSSSPRFEGCLLSTAVFRSPHMYSMGFRSGLIAGHFGKVQCFVLNHSWVLFKVLGVIVLLQDPWLSTKTQLSDTGLNIALQNASVISWFHDAMHTFKAPSARGSTATSKTSLNLLHVWL